MVDRWSAAGCSCRVSLAGIWVSFRQCSVNGRFLNGYCYIIILFWKNEGLKIVKMLNKRTNVRTCSVLDSLG